MTDILLQFVVIFAVVIGLYLFAMMWLSALAPTKYERWKAWIAADKVARKARREEGKLRRAAHYARSSSRGVVHSVTVIEGDRYSTLDPVVDALIAEQAYEAVAMDVAYVVQQIASESDSDSDSDD